MGGRKKDTSGRRNFAENKCFENATVGSFRTTEMH